MRHELRHALRERTQHGERRRRRPVGAGPRLAEEVIGCAQAGGARARARGVVLAAHGHTQRARDVHHDLANRRMQADVMMRVQVRRRAPERLLELRDLRLDLGAHVGRGRARRRVACVAHESPLVIDERAPAGQRLAEREVHVQPDAEPAVEQACDEGAIEVRGHEHGGAGDDAVAMRGQDALAHAAGHPPVVGVHDQPPAHRARPSSSSRSTVAGRPAGNVASRSIARRCARRS